MKRYFDFGSVRPFQYFFGLAGILGVIFAFISENEQRFFVMHLALWMLQTLGPIAILVYTHIGLHKLRFFDEKNAWLKLLVSGIIGAAIFSPIALCLDVLWGNDSLPNNLNKLVYLWLDELLGVIPPITISWIAINAPWLLGYKLITANIESSEKQELIAPKLEIDKNSANKDDFLLPINQDTLGEIIYLKSELHYLLVVGTKGKDLILYNLRDAIQNIPGHLGAQAHRSYWVTYSHITKVIKQGRQAKIVMSNGAEIPVSRNNIELFSAYL
ncbi:LytTR family DNA-binding domain-containing protein [Glaciecola petra]|uniref:LytTR family DNA-binding domain-containing protein n=1 Tax=Glaciecola petra TaxID=3075602 RepID=A0ABU2ZVE1_9ALTE|nr:LytTR family DNA-binding domain-containing protein [Aestuariibacter sp. P117]MDT0596575.1 LytTR family DNA-binding domain-containing protein [Aestuariibacter sp. P117]